MSKTVIKTGDEVVLLTGQYKYKKDENGNWKTHKVIAVSPEEGKVIIEGANKIKKHVKPRRQGETGGIVETEGALYASKVALYCPACKKGVRVKKVVSEETDKNGKTKRVVKRVCAKCGQEL